MTGDPRDHIPGWEGTQGPFPSQYSQPHVYARDIHSGAGNCVCGAALRDERHVQAAPGVPIPRDMRVDVNPGTVICSRCLVEIPQTPIRDGVFYLGDHKCWA